MAVIHVPRRLYMQPQGAVEVDPRWAGATVINPAVPHPAESITGTILRVPTPLGIAAENSGASRIVRPVSGDQNNGYTLLMTGIAVTSIQTDFCSLYSGTTLRSAIAITSASELIFYPKNGIADTIFSSTVAAGSRVTVVATATGTAWESRADVNGVIESDQGTYFAATGTYDTLFFGRRFFFGTTRGALLALIPRTISSSELDELVLNPWQIFRAPQRRLYVQVGGGPASYAISGDVRDEAFTTGAIGRQTAVLADSLDDAVTAGVIARSTPVLGDILDDGAVAGSIGRSTAITGDDLADGVTTGDVEASGPSSVDITAGVTAAAFTTGAIGRSTAIAGADLDDAFATGAITIDGEAQTVSAEGGVTANAFCTGSLGVTPYFPWAIRIAPGIASVRAVKLRGTPR